MCLASTERVEQVKSKGEEEKKRWHSIVVMPVPVLELRGPGTKMLGDQRDRYQRMERDSIQDSWIKGENYFFNIYM